MKIRPFFAAVVLVATAAIAAPVAVPVASVEAAAGDPTVSITVTPNTNVHVGDTVAIHVTVVPGANGVHYVPWVRATSTNPRTFKTNNWFQFGAGTDFTTVINVPAGYRETFAAEVDVPASGHLVRPITASVSVVPLP